MLRVRAGNVQLVSGNSLALVQNLDCVLVIFARITKYVCDDDCVFDLAQPWKLFFNEDIGANVLQADRVQHSRSGFIKPRRRIADHWFAGKSLDHQTA